MSCITCIVYKIAKLLIFKSRVIVLELSCSLFNNKVLRSQGQRSLLFKLIQTLSRFTYCIKLSTNCQVRWWRSDHFALFCSHSTCALGSQWIVHKVVRITKYCRGKCEAIILKQLKPGLNRIMQQDNVTSKKKKRIKAFNGAVNV